MIAEHGAVSNEVAEAMADGALERFEADVARRDHRDRRADGRHRGEAGRLRLRLREDVGRREDRPRPGDPGTRADIRERSALLAMHLVRRLLLGEDFVGPRKRRVEPHEQIVAAADGKVEGEILAAAFAKPRGSTTAAAGGGVITGEIGARWAGKQHKGSEGAGIELGNPGAIAVTPLDT